MYLAVLYTFRPQARESHKDKAEQFCIDGRGKQPGVEVEVRQYFVRYFERPPVVVHSLVAEPIDMYRNENKTDGSHKVHNSRQTS